jgi:hypothetical protein
MPHAPTIAELAIVPAAALSMAESVFAGSRMSWRGRAVVFFLDLTPTVTPRHHRRFSFGVAVNSALECSRVSIAPQLSHF